MTEKQEDWNIHFSGSRTWACIRISGPHSLGGPSGGSRVHIPNKFPGDAEATGLKTRLSENHWPTSGFLNLSVTDIWGQISLVVRDCSVHCRMFTSISGLCPLDASSDPCTCDNQNVSKVCQMSHRGETAHWEPLIQTDCKRISFLSLNTNFSIFLKWGGLPWSNFYFSKNLFGNYK